MKTGKLMGAAALCAFVLLSACDQPGFGQARTPYASAQSRLELLNSRLQKNPNDIGALNAIGYQNARLSDWSRSLSAYHEALLVNGSNREAQLGYTRGLIATGNYGQAESTIAGLLTATSPSVDALILHAGALAGQKKYRSAKAVLLQAQALAPRDLDVRSNLALIAALSRDPSAYSQGRSVAFAPDADVRHQRNLVLIGGITGQAENARRDGARLGLSPDTIKGLIGLGSRSRSGGLATFGLAPVA